jgi:hypothetical protein
MLMLETEAHKHAKAEREYDGVLHNRCHSVGPNGRTSEGAGADTCTQNDRSPLQTTSNIPATNGLEPIPKDNKEYHHAHSLYREHSVEDDIPDFAYTMGQASLPAKGHGQRTSDAEAELEVLVMVCEVVFLHLTHVLRQPGVVERVVHAVVEDVWDVIRHRRQEVNESNEQKMYEPAMTPLAMAVGNRLCARRVNGYDKAANRMGGITRRSLNHPSAYASCHQHGNRHLSIGT